MFERWIGSDSDILFFRRFKEDVVVAATFEEIYLNYGWLVIWLKKKLFGISTFDFHL